MLSWSNVDIQPATLKNALAPQTSGYADLRLGAAAWLIDDDNAGHFLGINGIITAPTGTYHTTQSLNIGENRYRFSLGGGWVHPFVIRDLLFEVSPEITFYGDNNEYLGNRKLEQKNSYALTSYLRYRMTQPWHLHVGWQGNWGGQNSINGIDQNPPPSNHRWMLGSTWKMNQHNQVILRLAKDYKIENGFQLDKEIALRWMLMW